MSGNVTSLAGRETEHVPSPEAARLLELPPGTLERWACEFSFPRVVGENGVPCFRRDEIDALQATLAASHSVEGAIREARRRLGHEG